MLCICCDRTLNILCESSLLTIRVVSLVSDLRHRAVLVLDLEVDARPPEDPHCALAVADRQQFLKGTRFKVATDTNILDLRTRYRTKLVWFFWF